MSQLGSDGKLCGVVRLCKGCGKTIAKGETCLYVVNGLVRDFYHPCCHPSNPNVLSAEQLYNLAHFDSAHVDWTQLNPASQERWAKLSWALRKSSMVVDTTPPVAVKGPTLDEIMTLVNAEYPDNLIHQTYVFPHAKVGDGLATFIVSELKETYDPTDLQAWKTAYETLEKARLDLTQVVNALFDQHSNS